MNNGASELTQHTLTRVRYLCPGRSRRPSRPNAPSSSRCGRPRSTPRACAASSPSSPSPSPRSTFYKPSSPGGSKPASRKHARRHRRRWRSVSRSSSQNHGVSSRSMHQSCAARARLRNASIPDRSVRTGRLRGPPRATTCAAVQQNALDVFFSQASRVCAALPAPRAPPAGCSLSPVGDSGCGVFTIF